VQEEEEYLIDLMHEEEMAERRRHDAEAAAAKREAAKREMMAANKGKCSSKPACTALVFGSTCADHAWLTLCEALGGSPMLPTLLLTTGYTWAAA
jgi:hypothetical protein